MAQINVQNLTFSYEGNSENIFENVNLIFDTDWKLGLIGRNGRGKTTFLNLLLGKYIYSGKITKSVNVDYFPFEVSDKNKPTLDVIASVYPDYELWKIIKNLNELELDDGCIYQEFNTLSNGEQTKVLLATLFSKDNNFLLIDEPTNHLDYNSREAVKKFLNKQKGFILVSHDRNFIDNCVDHIISINKRSIDIQKGNFTTWWDNKTNQDNFEIMQNEKIKKDIARLNESARQAMLWSDKVEKTKNGTKISGVKADKGAIGHKAAKMAKRSKVIESRINKAIIEKSKLLNNIEEQSELFFNSEKLSGNKWIELKDVSIYYNEKCVLKNISFNVEKGDRVAICGKNGGGKTSILKLMLGEPIKHSGTLYKSNKLKISYISQKYDWLDGTLINFASCNNLDKTKFLTMLTKLGFNRSQFDICINNFSEGQKKKVLIAKSLCEEANIYVWDEPLNYIDVISRIQIENLIKESNITLIFVEHDIAFINNLATKIINI